ncbi:hypothetical protein [Aeromicrobium sp. UC242_57]|uniref:hypothetical protein n=1 Tax=Aeromicrobium sp. UC242_57 TaxID=3374624 RepID=UPI00379A9010
MADRRKTLIGGALAAVLVAALVAIVVNRSGAEKVINAGGDTLVLVGKESDEGATAMGEGVLTDVGGCLGLNTDGRSVVVVWPHGTTVQTPDPLRIRFDGKTYELGDTVKLGGGFAEQLASTSYFYDQVPKTCQSTEVFYSQAG